VRERYLEDQDFWRISGIERDVFLYALPKLTVWDFFLKADLENQYRDGLFNGYVTLRKFSGDTTSNGIVTLEIFDRSGDKIFTQQQKTSQSSEGVTVVHFNATVFNPSKWEC
jgi:beta-galactosidase